MPRLGLTTLLCALIALFIPHPKGSAQSLDSSFVPELTSDVVINSLAIQPDGKVIIAFGLGPDWPNASTNFIRANEISLVRLNTDGRLDPTFARVPHASTPYRRSASSVVLLTNGSVIVSGDFFVPGGFGHFGLVKVSSNGVVDESFRGSVGSGQILEMLLQPDGRLLVCGYGQVASGSNNKGIARLNTDGNVDESFESAISHTNDGVFVYSMCLQPDGKIVIAGSFTHVDSVYAAHVARLNPNGSLDSSFGPVTFEEPAFAKGVTRQSDGKILVSGRFPILNGTARRPVLRLETNGVEDSTFITGPTGDPSDVVYGTRALANGQILAFGVFDHFAGQAAGSIVRLENDGALDPSFDVGELGPPNYGGITRVGFDTAGRMLVAAKFLELNGIRRHAIARFLTSASPGTIQFVSANIIAGEDQGAAAELTVSRLDGRSGPVSVVYSTGGGTAVAGFDYRGSTGLVAYADGEFAPKSFTVPIYDDPLLEGEKFLNVVLSNPDNGVVLGNPSTAKVTIPANDFVGGVDTTFFPGHVAADSSGVYAMAIQADGKILIGGSFKRTDSPSGLARLNADGSLDPDFHIGNGIPGFVSGIALQPDAKIVVAGYFGQVNGVGASNIARLNPDGSVDRSFVSVLSPSAGIECIGLQSDGKIVIGGYLYGFSEETYTLLGRLNADGSIDTTFAGRLYDWGSDTGFVNRMAVDAQDRVYLLGNLQFAPDVRYGYGIARLASNGSLDPGFAPRDGTNVNLLGPRSVLPLADGKVLICGGFTQIEGQPRNGVARLNTDGSLDRSFVPGLPSGTWATAAALQADGKFVIVHQEDDYQDGVGRLNSDGSLDASFRTVRTEEQFESIRSIAVASDGAILIAGEFDLIDNSVVRHNVARLISDVQPPLRLENIDGVRTRLKWPAALSNTVVEFSTSLPAAWLELPGTPVQSGNDFVLTNSPASPRQFYRLRPR